MAGKVSHKLSNALEGALAGGGDPATSPLYVFGPFLRLIVVAGVASVTFGTSVWMVVFTIATVSAMYRLVMYWVVDGSGGSGLNEEEFGRWAVKINAAITFIEYTLTFLVSMAAMVTFIADRLPLLNEAIFGIQYRTFVAIILSLLTGWLVNRGPKTASRAFGPATAGVLILLWLMVFATIFRYGLQLPGFNLEAFSPDYLHFTFGGFARILAVMTGVEVFANLVPAYEGKPAEKSRKAFNSLLIIMGTTIVTMLVVGPAIFNLSDPTNTEVSVFTQTMDILLPAPLAYLGTLVGIAVLLSASAASAQGLQNLALGLKDRQYVPAVIGQKNAYDVADKPVWIEVGLVSITFLFFGTHEETYLAIYAAGVFILLSMTGWAATRRLLREARLSFTLSKVALIAGTVLAAVLTTVATLIIFQERFFEGAWTYLIFVPLLYAIFTYFRRTLGDPSPAVERLGQLEEAMREGFGYGQSEVTLPEPQLEPVPISLEAVRPTVPIGDGWESKALIPKRIVVPLDGSPFAEEALPAAILISKASQAELKILSALPINKTTQLEEFNRERVLRENYLQGVINRLTNEGVAATYEIHPGSVVDSTYQLVSSNGVDLIITSTRGGSGAKHWLSGGVARKIINVVDRPVLVVQPEDGANGTGPGVLKKILVTLDGSEYSERVIPYAKMLAEVFGSELLLLSVPEVPRAEKYGAMADLVEEMRTQAEAYMRSYLEEIAARLQADGISVRILVTGSSPARTICLAADYEEVDLILMATRGRGGLDRLLMGSVTERVVQNAKKPVFLLPVHEKKVPV